MMCVQVRDEMSEFSVTRIEWKEKPRGRRASNLITGGKEIYIRLWWGKCTDSAVGSSFAPINTNNISGEYTGFLSPSM